MHEAEALVGLGNGSIYRIDSDLTNKTRTHHHDDHEHSQPPNGKAHGEGDDKCGNPHRDKVQAPRLPHKGPFQLFQIFDRGIVGIINAVVFQKKGGEREKERAPAQDEACD